MIKQKEKITGKDRSRRKTTEQTCGEERKQWEGEGVGENWREMLKCLSVCVCGGVPVCVPFTLLPQRNFYCFCGGVRSREPYSAMKRMRERGIGRARLGANQ